MSHKPLIIICGPTASGKTRLAVDLAQQLGGEVVSADSMQLYTGMNIGTAKPTFQEMCGIKHHLIDFLPPDESFSVARYTESAREIIAELHTAGKIPVMAGGTGLYIQAVADNIQFFDMPENAELREKLRAEAAVVGAEEMHRRLYKLDQVLAEKLHPNNMGRVLRGLEVFELTGKPLSQWQAESRAVPGEYSLCMIGLTFRDRKHLYERINMRVDKMLEDGLLKEAEQLYNSDFAGTAAQAIGYKELFGYFGGEHTLEQATELLKRETRRYAKRQLTWFSRDERIHWLYMDNGYEPVYERAAEIISAEVIQA